MTMALSNEVRDKLMRLTARCNRLVFYYAWETTRRSRWATNIQILVLISAFSSASAVVGLLIGVLTTDGVWLEITVSGSNVVVTFGVILSLTWNHPNKISQLNATSGKCREILVSLEALELERETLSETEVIRQMKMLDSELEKATSPVESAGIGYSKRRNIKANKDAWDIVYDRFGISSRSSETAAR